GQRRDDGARQQLQLALARQVAAQVVGAEDAPRPAEHLTVARRDVAIAAHSSHMPITNHRAGEFLLPRSCRQPAPSLHRITRSPTPAPSESIARIGSPSGLPSAVRSCTTGNRQPTRLACFTVATAWPTISP